MAKDKKLVEAITSMDVDFAQWYTDVVKKSRINRLFQRQRMHDVNSTEVMRSGRTFRKSLTVVLKRPV